MFLRDKHLTVFDPCCSIFYWNSVSLSSPKPHTQAKTGSTRSVYPFPHPRPPLPYSLRAWLLPTFTTRTLVMLVHERKKKMIQWKQKTPKTINSRSPRYPACWVRMWRCPALPEDAIAFSRNRNGTLEGSCATSSKFGQMPRYSSIF